MFFPDRAWARGRLDFSAICVAVLLSALAAGCTSRHAGVPGTTDAGGDRVGGDAASVGDSGGDGAGSDGAASSGDIRIDGTTTGSDGAATGGSTGNGTGGAATGGTGGGAGGSAGATRDGGGDAATGDAAVGDAGYGAGCNTLAPAGPVTVVCAGDAGVAPAPTGGPLVAGIYRLTAITAYGPCAEIAVAQSLVLTATTIQIAVEDPFTGVSRANATYSLAGSSLIQTNTCPDTTTRALGYSSVTVAGTTTLTLITVDSGTTTVATMTRP